MFIHEKLKVYKMGELICRTELSGWNIWVFFYFKTSIEGVVVPHGECGGIVTQSHSINKDKIIICP